MYSKFCICFVSSWAKAELVTKITNENIRSIALLSVKPSRLMEFIPNNKKAPSVPKTNAVFIKILYIFNSIIVQQCNTLKRTYQAMLQVIRIYCT